MKISLRKAKSLQNEITNAINALPLTTSVVVTDGYESSHAQDAITEASNVLTDNITKRSLLNEVLFKVRKSLDAANHEFGVSNDLAYREQVKKEISDYDIILAGGKNNIIPKDFVLNSTVKRLSQPVKDDDYFSHRQNSASLGIISDEQFNAFNEKLIVLRKEFKRINDEIFEKNVAKQITLENDVVVVLKEHNIL